MENIDQQIKKNGLYSGLLLGAISFVLGIFSFYFITGMTTSFWLVIFGPIIFSIIVPIIIVIFFCIDARKKIGGFWNFRQAVTGIFIMFFVAYIVQSIGRDLIFEKIIEPNMTEKTQDAIIKATAGFMEKSGADQATIDTKIADMQKSFDDQKNGGIGKKITGIGVSIILIFVVSLIFAAIFKRQPPRALEPMDEIPTA